MKLSAAAPTRTPREPLYTFAEVADRLGVSDRRLGAISSAHPGLSHVESTPGCYMKAKNKRYRMSEARRWWAGLPQHLKESQ